MAPTHLKIIEARELEAWRGRLQATEKPLVVTNGCFDLIHVGHVKMLEEARHLGGALLVGVTGDKGVRQLKGPMRPLCGERERAEMLAGLEAVTAVTIFDEVDASEFLKRARPDIYVKGGDYTLQTIHAQERRVLEEMGAQIKFMKEIPGVGTRALVAKIQAWK